MRVCVQDRQRVRIGCAGRAGAPLTRSSLTRARVRFPPTPFLSPPHPLSQLHVFVKKPGDPSFAEVLVDDTASVAHLQEAAVAKLKLGVSPDRVEMFREKDGEATGDAFDSRKKLATVGVSEGTSLVVKVAHDAGISPAPFGECEG